MPPITEKELHNLYHVQGLTQAKIAERLEVSQSSVSKWMKSLEINSKYAGSWTKEEINLLKENYPGEESDISPLFPERTWNAIKLKAMEIGVSRDQEEYRKSEEFTNKLREISEQNKIKVRFERKDSLSYVLGVVDGDGYDDSKGSIGLEVIDKEFAEKFIRNLKMLNLNPNSGKRRGKFTVWASSTDLVDWFREVEENKVEWLTEDGNPWLYLKSLYDSDGNLHPSGSPRICSYDEDSKKLIHNLFSKLGITSNIQQNNVWVSAISRDKFFENIDPVLERRRQKRS